MDEYNDYRRKISLLIGELCLKVGKSKEFALKYANMLDKLICAIEDKQYKLDSISNYINSESKRISELLLNNKEINENIGYMGCMLGKAETLTVIKKILEKED